MSKKFNLITLILLFCLSCSAKSEQEEVFDEGIEYKKLTTPLATSAPAGKIEVLEIFWYGCPHCYHLENDLKNRDFPDYIDFKLLPAISPQGWAATGAQVFFTATALGVADKIHIPLFKAIHDEKRTELISDVDAIGDFFTQFGVSEDKFHQTWKSFYVNTKLRSARGIFRASGIDSVPTIIVNGKYITSPSMAHGVKNMLKVIEYLAAKEEK